MECLHVTELPHSSFKRTHLPLVLYSLFLFLSSFQVHYTEVLPEVEMERALTEKFFNRLWLQI